MFPLKLVETGTQVTVAKIETEENSLINKLAAMGVSIGGSFLLQQFSNQ